MPIIQGQPLIIQIGVNDEPAGSLTATVDEYFWQNPVPPPPALSPWVWPQQWAFDDQTPVLFGQFDEDDIWQNPNRPIRASWFIAFPYLPDPEEIPAGSLTPPVVNANYINSGVHNFIVQEIGDGIKF